MGRIDKPPKNTRSSSSRAWRVSAEETAQAKVVSPSTVAPGAVFVRRAWEYLRAA
jgi:hypothetical protein